MLLVVMEHLKTIQPPVSETSNKAHHEPMYYSGSSGGRANTQHQPQISRIHLHDGTEGTQGAKNTAKYKNEFDYCFIKDNRASTRDHGYRAANHPFQYAPSKLHSCRRGFVLSRQSPCRGKCRCFRSGCCSVHWAHPEWSRV